MLNLQSPNFNQLRALEQVLREDLAAARMSLDHAELIFRIAPGASVSACRTASEQFCRAFERHHATYTASNGNASQGDRWRALRDASAGAKLARARRAWIGFESCYRDWSLIIHGRVTASQADALRAIRNFHDFYSQLLADHCNGLKVEDFRVPAGIQPAAIQGQQLIQELQAAVKASGQKLKEQQEEAEAWQQKAADAERAQVEANARLQALQERTAASPADEELRRDLAQAVQSLGEMTRKLEEARGNAERTESARRELEQDAEALRERVADLERFQSESSDRVASLEQALEQAQSDVEKSKAKERELEDERRRLRETLDETSTELRSAREAAESFRRKQEAGDRSGQLRELLTASEAQVVKLAAQEERLRREAAAKDAQLREALDQSRTLQADISSLQSDLDELRSETADLHAEIDRLDAYRRHYPESKAEVPAFLRKLLFRRDPAPPFEHISGPTALCGDPYCDRFEATFQLKPCTVRIWTDRSDRDLAERADAWMIEASNLLQMDRLSTRPGIVRLLVAADPELPGFSVFARPQGRCLTEYGAQGLAIGLLSAASVTISLLNEMAACDSAGLVTAWPDRDAVAIVRNSVVLLDPTAPHCGDLGPQSHLDQSAHSAKFLSEAETSAARVYAAGHAFVRLIGLIPSDSAAAPALALRRVKDVLMELRRMEERPVAEPAASSVALMIAESLEPDPGRRPSLRRLHDGLRELVQPTA